MAHGDHGSHVVEHTHARSLVVAAGQRIHHGVVLRVAHGEERIEGLVAVAAHAQCRNQILSGWFILLHHAQHVGSVNVYLRLGGEQ